MQTKQAATRLGALVANTFIRPLFNHEIVGSGKQKKYKLINFNFPSGTINHEARRAKTKNSPQLKIKRRRRTKA